MVLCCNKIDHRSGQHHDMIELVMTDNDATHQWQIEKKNVFKLIRDTSALLVF